MFNEVAKIIQKPENDKFIFVAMQSDWKRHVMAGMELGRMCIIGMRSCGLVDFRNVFYSSVFRNLDNSINFAA